jgi:hypothetical protein
LRALRWSLVGIGLALPAAFALAAKAAEKGWGMEAFTGYSMRTILLEAVPAALGLGLWPLAAMVIAVQAFTADRADGTEAFLLDRPVSRAWVWTSRLVASLGSLGEVVLVGLGMVLAFAAIFGEAGLSRRVLFASAVACAVLMLAAVVAALGATSLVSAALPAFLIALLLAATPVLAGVGGALIFPYASWQGIPLAGLAACLVGLAMPLASWVADTRGEPAGRGRRLRSAVVLGGGLLLSGLGFVLAAPVLVRAGAPRSQLSVIAPAAGGTTLVTGERGFRVPDAPKKARVPSALANGPAGFLVDLTTGERRAFLAPEVQSARWDAEGTKLAVMDNARPLGGIGASRLRFLDAEGQEIWPSFPEPDGVAVRDGLWAGDRLVIVYDGLEKPATRVDVLDPASGRQTTIFESTRPSFATLHAARDGRVFLYTVESDAAADGPVRRDDWDRAAWSLRPLDAAQVRLGPPVLEGHGAMHSGLSPSGRYWMQRSRGPTQLVDLTTGAATTVAAGVRPAWMAWMSDDSLVWLEGNLNGWTLFRMAPGASPHAWASGPERFPLLKVSPGGAFAAVILTGIGSREERPVLLLEAAASEGPRSLTHVAPFRIDGIDWAGPHTLAATKGGRLALYDVVSGKSTVVFGRR